MLLGGVDFTNLFINLSAVATPASPRPRKPVRRSSVTASFLTTAINFLIVAFAIFLVIKTVNSMQKKKNKTAPLPQPPRQRKLLTEIRDLLKKPAKQQHAKISRHRDSGIGHTFARIFLYSWPILRIRSPKLFPKVTRAAPTPGQARHPRRWWADSAPRNRHNYWRRWPWKQGGVVVLAAHQFVATGYARGWMWPIWWMWRCSLSIRLPSVICWW